MKTVAWLLFALAISLAPVQAAADPDIETRAAVVESSKPTEASSLAPAEVASPASASSPVNTPSPAGTQSYLRKVAAPNEEKVESPAQRSEPSLVRVIMALFLIALLGGIAMYAKRRKGGGSALLRDRVRLHTIGSVQLGPKAQIALLSVGREAILVGVSEQGITCLRNYREDELGTLTTRNAPVKEESENIEMEAENAFNDLLVRAAQRAPRSEPRRVAPQQSQMRRAVPADEFTPSGFRDVGHDDDELEEQMPPHLVELLAQASLQSVKPSLQAQNTFNESNVKPLRPQQTQQRNQFAEPEGQAAELMRRFSELAQ